MLHIRISQQHQICGGEGISRGASSSAAAAGPTPWKAVQQYPQRVVVAVMLTSILLRSPLETGYLTEGGLQDLLATIVSLFVLRTPD